MRKRLATITTIALLIAATIIVCAGIKAGLDKQTRYDCEIRRVAAACNYLKGN